MTKVRFEPFSVEIALNPGEDLLSAARRQGVSIRAVCGGSGTCGACRVQILEGRVGPPTIIDQQHLPADQLQQGWRLACQYSPHNPVVARVPHINFDGLYKANLGLDTTIASLTLNPNLIRLLTSIPEPSLEDNRSDASRLLAMVNSHGYTCQNVDLFALQQLPHVVRDGKGAIDVWIRSNRVIAIQPAVKTGQGPYGIAYDIGTTTIAAYLVDLMSGKVLAASSAANAQADFGNDVMSRLAAARKGHLQALQARVISVMNGLADRLCKEENIDTRQIADSTAVGNTSMTHLLLGVDPTYLGLAPYIPVFQDGIDVLASALGLNFHPAASLFILPNIGGFVGADTVGAVIASDMDRSPIVQLLMDIGTNAELVLGSRDGVVACSTAAGPAFEGACITNGMRAGPGAIDCVDWIDGSLQVHAIQDVRPLGLAGSGLVSIAAALRRAGLMDANGLLSRQQLMSKPWFKIEGGQGVIELAPASQSGSRRRIILKEEDLVQLQLARAAMACGLSILLEEMNLRIDDIEGVLLAGAFGNYMRKEDAAAIGLFPPALLSRARGIGNAAGAGALRALVNINERQRAKDVAVSIRYIELSARPDFSQRYLESLSYPPVNMEDTLRI
jgi:uncharacterized 2Fe-2S/4Fe-4S cluster protein (DUF4445 family)